MLKPDLERMHDLGVDVVWFMPIHPIGKVERKGSLGSLLFDLQLPRGKPGIWH